MARNVENGAGGRGDANKPPAPQQVAMIGQLMANKMLKKTTDKKVGVIEEKMRELKAENVLLKDQTEDLKD